MRGGLLGAVVVLGGLVPSACSLADRPAAPPEGQIVLHVTTDAVLPPPPGETSRVVPLFDRLSIEIFPPGESVPCAGCARQFSVDARSMDEGRTSMGYVPRPGVGGSRARVRLFRTLGAEVVEARVTSTLETVVALPVVGEEGITEVTAVLDTSTLGAAVGTLDEPVAPAPGPPARGRVGSWEAARRRPCAGAVQEGEVCIDGGAFWLGRPAVALPFPDQKHGLERLVAVSPFFMDATEVTVKKFRAAGLADFTGPGRFVKDAECNFTDEPGSRENYPVNCISRTMAAAYCATRGARLPTEAEYEYVATAFGRYELHPWGTESPRCGDAIFGRSVARPPPPNNSTLCAPAKGSAAVGTATRDRLTVPGGGEIVDLVGNVTEWVSDDYGQESDPCWAAPILLDPRCTMPAAGRRWTGRGAFYATDVTLVDAKVRFSLPADDVGRPHSVGMRCVRSSEP